MSTPPGPAAPDAPQTGDTVLRLPEDAQAATPAPADSASRSETIATVLAGPRAERAPRPAPLTGKRLGPYELLEELGAGAMGVVYRARQIELDRIVALKVLRWQGEQDGERIQRFRREAQAAAKLHHPGLVPIHDVGHEGEYHYFSMEFVKGRTLAELVQRERPSPRRALEIVRDVARALVYAHGEGIVHRDIKPQNILVNEEGRPLLADFGLAKDLSRETVLTQEGTMLGTPGYMSPEQALGRLQETDARSDVYSLGAVLYYMLTSLPPFDGVTAIEVVTRVLNELPVPVRKLAPEVHPDIETLCMKCLEKERERRYVSAAALADDLHRFLEGLPIAARPPSLIGRVIRTGRRHLWPTLAAAAIVLAICGARFWYVWKSIAGEERAERESERLQQATRIFRVTLDLLASCNSEPPEQYGSGLAKVRDNLGVVLTLMPDYREATLRRSDVCALLGEFDAAARDLDALLQGKAGDADACYRYQALADDVREAGQEEACRGILEAAGRHAEILDEIPDSDYPKGSRLRGRLRAGDAEGALVLARELMKSYAERPDIVHLTVEAMLLAGLPDPDEALALLDRLLRIRPRNHHDYRLRARVRLALHRDAEAVEDLWFCLRLQGRASHHDLERLCAAYAAQYDEDQPEYREAMERVVAQFPEGVPAWLGLARANRKTGRLAEARAACGKAEALAPKELAVILESGWTRSEKYWCGNSFGSDRASPLFSASLRSPIEELIERGDATIAAEIVEVCLEAEPNRPDLLALLARAHLAHGAAWDVGATLERALKARPRDPSLWTMRGVAGMQAGKPEQALADLGKAVALDPRRPDAHVALGVLHLAAGRLEPAVEALAAAVLCIPTRRLGEVLLHWSDGRFSLEGIVLPDGVAARTRCGEAFRASVPALAAVLVARGDAHFAAGRAEQAEPSFSAACLVDPAAPGPYVRLARIHVRRRDWIAAIACLEQAVACGYADTAKLADDPDLRELLAFPRVKNLVK